MKPSTALAAILFASVAAISGHAALAATEGAQAPTPQSAPAMAEMPMHRQMQQMHSQMQKLHATTDPVARKALMKEHMASMQGMMKMMHGMMAGSPQPKHGHGEGKSSAMQPCSGQAGGGGRMGMLEQRMNMMQLMMDQMLQRQMPHKSAE